MSRFPEGKFTIVNNETGRAVRVRLGLTHDASEYRLGSKYLLTVSEKPWLELGQADNSPATVWWHSTSRSSQQIVSHAVSEYQNIGNYCVWMHADSSNKTSDLFSTEHAFQNRLDDMPADVRGRLAPLIPAEWTTIRARKRAEYLAATEQERAYADAEMEAWAAQENPPSAEDLSLLHAYRLGDIDGSVPSPLEREAYTDLPEGEQREMVLRSLHPKALEMLQTGLDERMRKVVDRLEDDPRAKQVEERAEKLLPEVKERRAAAAQATIPLEDLRAWHSQCAFLTAHGSGAVLRLSGRDETDEDRRITAAMARYVKAAAKEGIVPPVIASDSTTRLYGCGAVNAGSSTYNWTYDGTYIYAADSDTIPSQQTYWTDNNGYLVGRPKGGPGQTWSIVKWTPTKPEPGTSLSETALTGLFGPLDTVFGI